MDWVYSSRSLAVIQEKSNCATAPVRSRGTIGTSYYRLLQEYRFGEFSAQCAAIRRGLATVVPYAALSLFTWAELESEVVGVKTVDVDYLEQNTEYDGCSNSDPHVRFFWAVMRTRFDDEQRAQLLRRASRGVALGCP